MKQVEIHEYLSELPLFQGLDAAELMEIVDIAQAKDYRRGMYVFLRGEMQNRIFLINKGRIKLFRQDFSGREQIISMLEPGSVFPLTGFFRRDQFPGDALVLEDATVIVISLDDFEPIMLTYSILCKRFFKIQGEKLFELQNRLEEQLLYSTYEQIIKLFLRLCETHGEKQGDVYRINTPFTNRELANMIGTSRETISRTINQLRKKNILDYDIHHHFHINFHQLKGEL